MPRNVDAVGAPKCAMTMASLTAPDPSLINVVVTPLPASLLSRPLDYLLAEHMRLRAVCSLLRYAGEVCQLDAGCAKAIARFITSALPLHRDDEEKNLFPALLKSARAGDELAETITRLEADHRQMKAVQMDIVDALTAEPDSAVVSLSPSAARTLRDFAETERRHVAVENGIVLAIARARITAKGLAEIADAMMARRKDSP